MYHIDKVIKDNKDNDQKNIETDSPPGLRDIIERKRTITRHEFYMRAPRLLVEDYQQYIKSNFKFESPILGGKIEDFEEIEQSGDDIEIMGEIANKQIIRLIINETGKRLHKMGLLEENLDETTGTGISDNMEGVQAALIGMVRAFEDNKKLSANVTTAVKKRFFNDPNQLDSVIPGKNYDVADSCDDVRKAILPILHQDVGESLMSGIGLMKQFGDDVSMLPAIMQGFVLPKQKPDTAFEMNQLQQQAGKYIGQVIRNNDEQFIEPEIWDNYEYNMLYDPDDSIKVNCKVVANGFSSFQNKIVRGERMKQSLALFVTNEILTPYVKIKPHLDVIYESMDEDPDRFINTEDEVKEIFEQRRQLEEQAKQEALDLHKMETEKEIALKDQEHRHKMEQNEQDHVHDIEMERLKAGSKV